VAKRAKYNSVQIFDDTDQELDLRTWTVMSLSRPGPDEPIALNGTVAPGGGATFLSGASKTRVLIGRDIFKPGQPGEDVSEMGRGALLSDVASSVKPDPPPVRRRPSRP
jgi:hypothetical protein